MKSVNFDDIVFWSVKEAVLSGRVRGMYKDETVTPARIMIEIVDAKRLNTDIHAKQPMYVPLTNLHPSEAACRKEIYDRQEAERNAVRNQIKTTKDLVKFLLTHDVISDSANPREREVVIEKANEFLNISAKDLW